MKKTIYICNRCGKEIKTEGTRIIPHFFDTGSGGELGNIGIPDDDVHFCMGCTKKIMEGLLRPPDGDEKDTGEEPAKKEKKMRRKKEDRLDAGKVMALHRAGWSNEKIADEMGVGERQVYQCIRYQTKKNSTDGEASVEEEEEEVEERL